MKFIRFLIILLPIFLLALTGGMLFYSFYVVKDVRIIEMKAKVGDVYGLDVNSTAISFGIIPNYGNSERRMTIRNAYNIPLKVSIKTSGDMAGWVYASNSSFILNPAEEKEITFNAAPKMDVAQGSHKGTIKITFTRIL